MALSDAQLLMLDNLIYTNYVKNGNTVRDIITKIEEDNYNINVCEMTSDEWMQLVTIIKNDPVLLDYKVTNYQNDEKTGMRAACFVDNTDNPTDVNVVFRGTSGSFEWHDNGTGGYLPDTVVQQLTAQYVNNLPEEYGNAMTATGHSKGGNEAQYVTIVTDRIAKCVSFDGQGFSPEFLEKYKDEIEKKSQSIVSISASNDYVNVIIYPIAGKQIYVETEEQDQFLYYHKPNIMFDENGNLGNEVGQSYLSKLINEYTTYMVSNLDEPERSITIDGLIALLESGEDKEHIIQTIFAAINAVSHIDDFVFDCIGETCGLSTELRVTYLLSLYCPYLFLDDLINSKKKIWDSILENMMVLANEIGKKLAEFGKKAVEFSKKFVDAVTTFAGRVQEWCNKNFNSGYQYALTNTYIKVNTAMLRSYADRLEQINRRITILDGTMDSLYIKVGLQGIWDLIQADALTGYSWRLNRCINYLNETASDFEAVERSICRQI